MNMQFQSMRRHWSAVRLVFKSTAVNRWRPLVAMWPFGTPSVWLMVVGGAALQCLVAALGLTLVWHRVPASYQWLVLTALAAMVLLESFAASMATDEQVFHRHHDRYWSPQWVGSDSYARVLVDVTTVELALRNGGYLVPVIVLLVRQLGPTALVAALACALAGQLVFLAKYFHRSQLNRFASVVWYFTGAAAGAGLVWLLFRLIGALLLISRQAVSSYGLGTGFVASTNHTLNAHLLAGVRAWGDHLTREAVAPLLPWSVAAVVVLGVALVLIRRGTLRPTPPSAFLSRYAAWVSRRSRTTSPLARRDLTLLSRTAPSWSHTDTNLVVPVETWLLLAANQALFGLVHNPWIISLLAVVEAYVLSVAVFRNFMNHFRGTLEFSQDARMIRLYRQSRISSTTPFLRAKATVLWQLSVPVLVANVALLTGGSVPVLANRPVWLLANLAVVPLLAVLGLGWVLRPPYDTFRWLMKSDAALQVDLTATDLRDVKGAELIQRANKMVMHVVVYLITLGTLFSAFLMLLRGQQWMYGYLAVLLALVVGLAVSNLGTYVELRRERAALGVAA